MFIENLLRKIEFKGKRRLIRYFFGARAGILNHSKCDINDELTERIEIEITELDKMDDKISRFQFMKIDCDGSDAAIILGGKNTLQKYKPIILFEDFSWQLSEVHHDCNRIKNEYINAYNLLRSIGYDVYGIRNKYLVKLEDEPSGYENVLAVHREDKCNIKARALEKKS